MPDGTPNFTPGPIFQKYLEDYADTFQIRRCLRLGERVTALAPRTDGASGWTISADHGGVTQPYDFDLAVVATGLYSSAPNLPNIPSREDFSGEVLHISQLKSRKPLTGKRVAVVGYGKGATDAALEAAAVASEAHIIFREAHWPVPRNLGGVLPFKWGMLNRLTGALIMPYVHPSPVALWVHTLGKPLVWIFWRAVELLLYVQWGLGTKIAKGRNLVPLTPVHIDCFGESTMLPRPDFFKLIRIGRIAAHRTEIAAFTSTGIALRDGDSLAVDCVVFATGWINKYDFLSDEARETLGNEEDGFYLYRHVLHPDLPNLFFIGRAATFLNIVTYCLQARWLAELIAGRFALPSREAMLAEITRLKAWKRDWMPFSAARGARLQLHMLYYHDELLRDFGANPLRKCGILAPLKELFVPYQPHDYRAIVADDLEAIKQRTGTAPRTPT